MQWILMYKWQIIGTLLGAVGGYFYWKKVGCITGTCPLQSHWQTMVAYGGFIGYWLSDMLAK